MAPIIRTMAGSFTRSLESRQATSSHPKAVDWRESATPEDLVLESWSEGLMVGALVIMACITIANMRRGVLLHKLILAELLLAMSHGTFCFMDFKGYGWYLSSTAMLLYFSWIMHNIVAWMKVRPFFSHPGGFFNAWLSKWTTRIYLSTLVLSLPVIIFQISNNFRFFNNRGGYYHSTRPYEPLMRDPWWIFTCIALFQVIRKCYGTGTVELVRRSPRFGILLCAIFLSIVFTACDIAASISSTAMTGSTEGINPWWKLSLVFKCLTDTIMLDDFKTELKRLGIKRIAKEEKRRNTISLVPEHETDGPFGSYDEEANSFGSQKLKSSHWFGRNSLARTSTACDISPTTSLRKEGIVSDEGTRGFEAKALNNPDANMDELEFHTALNLDPSHTSDDRTNGDNPHTTKSDQSGHHRLTRHPHERYSLSGQTRRLSKLPSLKQTSPRTIKPENHSDSPARTDDRIAAPE